MEAKDKAIKSISALRAAATLAEAAVSEIGTLNDGRTLATEDLVNGRNLLTEMYPDIPFALRGDVCKVLGRIESAISRLVEVGA